MRRTHVDAVLASITNHADDRVPVLNLYACIAERIELLLTF